MYQTDILCAKVDAAHTYGLPLCKGITNGVLWVFFHANQVNGKVYTIYDVGNGPQTLIEDRQNFNDGQYHYVQFVRNGAGATLRVDDYATRSVGAGGKVAWSLPMWWWWWWWWWYCLLCYCVVVETRKEAMPMKCSKSFHHTCVD